MYGYDTSTAQRAFETCKPFHHIFDGQGENLLTNGPDGANPYLEKQILYPQLSNNVGITICSRSSVDLLDLV